MPDPKPVDPRPPPEYFLGRPKLLDVVVEPKPEDLSPNPPLLRSCEETPVYLDAFALACS